MGHPHTVADLIRLISLSAPIEKPTSVVGRWLAGQYWYHERLIERTEWQPRMSPELTIHDQGTVTGRITVSHLSPLRMQILEDHEVWPCIDRWEELRRMFPLLFDKSKSTRYTMAQVR
jgi:hypothetical protein